MGMRDITQVRKFLLGFTVRGEGSGAAGDKRCLVNETCIGGSGTNAVI